MSTSESSVTTWSSRTSWASTGSSSTICGPNATPTVTQSGRTVRRNRSYQPPGPCPSRSPPRGRPLPGTIRHRSCAGPGRLVLGKVHHLAVLAAPRDERRGHGLSGDRIEHHHLAAVNRRQHLHRASTAAGALLPVRQCAPERPHLAGAPACDRRSGRRPPRQRKSARTVRPLRSRPMPDAPAIDPKQFRTVLGHFPTGVTIVTGMNGDRPAGFTIGSFTSVSSTRRWWDSCR